MGACTSRRVTMNRDSSRNPSRPLALPPQYSETPMSSPYNGDERGGVGEESGGSRESGVWVGGRVGQWWYVGDRGDGRGG